LNRLSNSESPISKQAQDLKDRIRRDSERYDETFRVGVEIEGCLLDNTGMLVNAAPLIEALKGKTHELDFEYGMCQFEYKTPPTPMHNLLNLNTLFEEFIEHLNAVVQKVYKNREMVFPVFLGANPSPEILKYDSNNLYNLVTANPRYKNSHDGKVKSPM
jgi:6-pyruvoyl-tetrahydropterin synthase